MSTNNTPLLSQNTVAIAFSADLPILIFFWSRGPGIFPFHACIFVSAEWRWTCVSSPVKMHSKEIVTMNGILLEEWPRTILCTLWSSDSAHGTHRAQTLWTPNFCLLSHTKGPNHVQTHSHPRLCYSRLLLQHVLCSRGCLLFFGLAILLSVVPTRPDFGTVWRLITFST